MTNDELNNDAQLDAELRAANPVNADDWPSATNNDAAQALKREILMSTTLNQQANTSSDSSGDSADRNVVGLDKKRAKRGGGFFAPLAAAAAALLIGGVVILQPFSEPSAAAALATAAQASADAGTIRATSVLSFSGDTDVVFDSDYVFDDNRVQWDITSNDAEAMGGTESIDFILQPGESFYREDGGVWTRQDLRSDVSPFEISFDINGLFARLQDDFDVEDLGIEQIDGISARRYSADVDLAKTDLAVALPFSLILMANDIPASSDVNIWIGESSGLIERIDVTISEDGQSATASTRFVEYGSSAQVTVPDPADVVEEDAGGECEGVETVEDGLTTCITEDRGESGN